MKILSLFLAVSLLFTGADRNAMLPQNVDLSGKKVESATEKKSYKDFDSSFDSVYGSEIVDESSAIFNEKEVNKYRSCSREGYVDEIREKINNSDIIKSSEDIQIRFLNDNEIKSSDQFVVLNTPEEIVSFVEEQQKDTEREAKFIQKANIIDKEMEYATRAASKSKTVNKNYSQGTVVSYNLCADITYDTSTKAISKVANRKFTMTRVTLVLEAQDRSYNTYFSPQKKACKITCDYSSVQRIITPLGAIEFFRNNAYIQFKWSYEKGVYAGEGGYGHSDTSFD